MQTPINEFKLKLKHDEPQIGLWMTLADPYVAELCATTGFDWISIDGEHAPNDLRHVLHTLQATSAYGSQAVVRVPHGDPALIKQVLELGVTNLVIPMVESAHQAQALVRAMRYPPRGIRGVGSAIARSSRWTMYSDYVSAAEKELCLIVQAETKAGIDQLMAICDTDGVDAVLIGPSDLAASMGYLGQAAHPEVVDTINKALGTIRRSGKAAGILCTDEKLARQYIANGANFIAVGVDSLMLVHAAKNLVGKFRSPPKA